MRPSLVVLLGVTKRPQVTLEDNEDTDLYVDAVMNGVENMEAIGILTLVMVINRVFPT